MRKNFLITLLTLAMISFSALAMASCDGNSGGNNSEPPITHTHVWNEYISKQATCSEKGEVLYSCDCGESYTAEVSALGHKIKTIQEKAPTCTEIGWYAYEICERDGCDYTTYEEIAIELNNHKFVDGVCSRCNEVYYSKGLKYTLLEDGTKYSVTGIGTCTDTEIVIPATYNNLPVTSIGVRAFQTCSGLTKVVVPDSVTNLADYAFGRCSGLTEIVLSNNVTNIGDYAFYDCSSLTEVIIPDGVTSIGNFVFAHCSSLTKVVIPDSVASIGERAFQTCSGLTKVVVPDSVTNLADYAFGRCSGLTEIVLSNNVTNIGDYAFYDCSSLTEVIIPDGVTSIGNFVFAYCSSLTEIIVDENNLNYCSVNGNLYDKDKTQLIQYAMGKQDAFFAIPDSVTSIGGYAFSSCMSLTKIVVSNSVTSIGREAFKECSSLIEIVISDSVVNIGDYAFHDTGYYNDVNNWENGMLYIGKHLVGAQNDISGKYTIKEGTLSIGPDAFERCFNLTKIVIPDSITSIGNSAFDWCSSLTSVTIPDSVTSIGYCAFAYCSSLTEVVIGNSVTSIDWCAFADCSSLTSITFNGTVEEWNAIEKGNDWNYGVPAKEVVCTGGIVSLQ